MSTEGLKYLHVTCGEATMPCSKAKIAAQGGPVPTFAHSLDGSDVAVVLAHPGQLHWGRVDVG